MTHEQYWSTLVDQTDSAHGVSTSPAIWLVECLAILGDPRIGALRRKDDSDPWDPADTGLPPHIPPSMLYSDKHYWLFQNLNGHV